MSESHSHDLPFWRKYIFSTDHKMIGLQYGLTALCFLLFGFSLMLLMRWELANPETAIPFIGKFLGESFSPMTPDAYNELGAMHGTIMVFLAIVPLVVGAFGNYVVPLQIGAPDMAFPKLNMASYWAYFVGGVVMFASFFIPDGAAKSGWTSYAPLSVLSIGQGQTFWLLGMVFLITSSLLGSINIITTIFQLRAKGLTFMRLPFFVWAQLVTNFLLLLAFPPLEAAGILQLMDRLAHTSFFMPSGLVISGQPLEGYSGGGSVLLWQHLFWFLAHPEVYVLILPAIGIIAEILANNIRKPLWGYYSMVWASIALGFLSFVVWAHHMYLTGMGTAISSFFQATTMIISIPSVIILTCLFISLWGGSIRINTPMLFALAFLPMFGIGGLTGLPLGLSSPDIHLHDTYYVIAHFHYIVAPGTIFAIFAGIYFWFPKVTGRRMNELLGHLHFWPSLFLMNCIFIPMFTQGMMGMSRRLYDGGMQYAHVQGVLNLHGMILYSAIGLAIFQLPFIINLLWSIFKGPKVTSDNPWDATTLEWSTPTPPPHGNFSHEPIVYRGPYEYSVPGASKDFVPQDQEVVK